jgi:hypothetical protein
MRFISISSQHQLWLRDKRRILRMRFFMVIPSFSTDAMSVPLHILRDRGARWKGEPSPVAAADTE